MSANGVAILAQVAAERDRQRDLWGEQNHPDGTGPDLDIIDDIGYFPGEVGCGNDTLEEFARDRTNALARVPGRVTFAHILTEEWAEAMAAENPTRLRAELVQVAAVAVQWIEAIDRRKADQ